MELIIVYQPPSKPAAILVPCDCGLTINEIGVKDVPSGLPFWIVPKAAIEAAFIDQGEYRDAWEISEQSIGRAPDGHGGAK